MQYPSRLVERGSARGVTRITQVVFDLQGGGLESIVASLAGRFAAGEFRTSVITLGGREGRVGAVVRPQVEQFHVLRPARGFSMVLPLGLTRRIRETRPDVVHLHSGAWYKPALASRLAGVPRVIFTEHGREHDDPPLARWLDRRAAGLTDRVVAVSDRLARYLRDVVRLDESRIETVPNGVDTGVFTDGPPPDGLRDSLGVPPDAWVIGSIGRLEAVKGYDRLIECVARLRFAEGLGRPVCLVICGEGSERAALESRARGLGVEKLVRLPGWSSRPADFYRLLDVFVLTSRSEGAPMSLLEAMACGVAPVVMDVGANREIVGPLLADQVVSAGDVDGAVRAIIDTLRSGERRDRACEVARRRVLERYSLDGMMAAYARLYAGAGA